MKKTRFILTLLVAAALFITGCGEKEMETNDESIVADWRTVEEYVTLEWSSPEETKTVHAKINDYDGSIDILEDSENYTVISSCVLVGGVMNKDIVSSTMEMFDYDGDGYDDFKVCDSDGEMDYTEVFLYLPADEVFTLSNDYSTCVFIEEGEASEEAPSGWKSAYASIVEKWEEEHGEDYIHGYRLFYLDEDDIPELALIGNVDWGLCELYTYKDDQAQNFYSAEGMGLDGAGLFYYEKSGIMISSSWMSGYGTETYTRPLSDNPDEIICYYQVVDDAVDESNNETYIYYLDEMGNRMESTYADQVIDVCDLPDRAEMEMALGVNDIFESDRIDNEDGLMAFEEIMEELAEG